MRVATSRTEPRREPDTTHDAVVVVPGIMGSELVDAASGDLLWGLHPGTFLTAWLSGENLRRLHLSDDERAGHCGRIAARRLLSAPAWLPFLQGFEPYADLVTALSRVVADRAAVRTFPYDWRLPVAHNAKLLAEAAMAHLDWWRRQPAHDRARRQHPVGREAKLVLVAHSMGGLLVRHLSLIPGVCEQIRTCVTLGTPFHGAPKAALMVATGRGAPMPLPARRPLSKVFARDADHGVRALARTLPGVYDLLPDYRCVIGGGTGRPLSVADLVRLGADEDLATASAATRARWRDLPLAGHEMIIGKAQPTVQGLIIADGEVSGVGYELRDGGELDRMGDGTVPTSAAELTGQRPWRLSQQHGALAHADDAIFYTVDMVREGDAELLGPPLAGEEGFGLQLPDVPVLVGAGWPAVITGLVHPRQATCTITSTTTGRVVGRPRIEVRDQVTQALVELPTPGLFRVTVAGSGATPTSQLVLAVPE